MHIKQQTVIPPGTKITKLAPGEAKAKSLKSLAQAAEKKLENAGNAELQRQRFQEARAKGMSIAEAAQYAMR